MCPAVDAQERWKAMLQTEGANYHDVKAIYEADMEGVDPAPDGDAEEMQFKRFQWFWEGRTETGDPAKSGLLKNYGLKLSQYFANEICEENLNPTPWTNVGPDKDPLRQHLGKVQCLWFDANQDPPMLIYAGSAHGGLWRSTDGGITWVNITDSFRQPVLGVYSLARIEVGGNPRLLIGTGSWPADGYSLGVLWSDDDGITWNVSSGIPTVASLGTIVDMQVYGNEVLAVQGTRAWRSTDHGESFTEITPTTANVIFGNVPDNSNRFTGIGHYLNGGDGVIVIAAKDGDATGNGPDIYASEDLGQHWARITDQLPIAMGSGYAFRQYFPLNGSATSYYETKWVDWDIGQNNDDLWDFDGTTDIYGQDGTMFISPTHSIPWTTAAHYCDDNQPHDGVCEDVIAGMNKPQYIQVKFVKDPDAEFNIYLTNDPSDLSTAQLVFSTELYPGVENNTQMPVPTFIADDDFKNLVVEAKFLVPGYVPVVGIRIDEILMGSSLVAVSQVSVVNDPGGAFDGFHLLTRSFGSTLNVKAHLYSGQTAGGINLHQLFDSNCDYEWPRDYNLGYDRFTINKFGRVFASGVEGIHEMDVASGACTEVLLGYDDEQSPYWNLRHDDVRSFFIADGATAGQERIAIGHDGGLAYRAVSGTWSDWNGESFPTVMLYDLGMDEFATRMLAGAQDNDTWEWSMDPAQPWTNIYGHVDGGSANVLRNRDGSIDLIGYTENASRRFKGTYLGNTINLSHSSDGCCFRLYWPSLISVASGEPRMYMAHSFNDTSPGVGAPGLYQVDPLHTGTNALNLTPGPEHELIYNATGLDIHPANEDIIFVGIGGHYWGTPDQYRLIRTTDHGANWTDLTSALVNPASTSSDQNVFSRYGVNTLTVDPDSDPNDIDHMTVYIGMDGIPDEDEFERVFKSIDGGTTWTDMSAGLPGFPVTDIVVQPGSGGILYASTDIGVYVYEPLNNHWYCFNEGFPVCLVTGLDLSACTGKLYASTYGRSIWSTDLYAPDRGDYFVVDTDLPLSGTHKITKNILVTAGNTLTITGTLEFIPKRKLFIEPGAKVDVNGGILTGRCDQPWDGVEVWGVTTEDQSPSTNQGELLMRNGAILENATVGVRLFATIGESIGSDGDQDYIPGTTGGIAHMHSGSIIRNCGRGVWFKPYKNMISAVEHVNRSHFLDAVFEKNGDAYDGMSYSDMARLEGVHGVLFSNAVFDNMNGHSETPKMIGIRSLDTKFTASNCTFIKLGIGVRGTDATGLKPCTIRGSDFENNDRGVVLTGVFNAEITNNTFTIPSGDGSWPLDQSILPYPVPYGAYLIGCGGYEVEDNEFNGVNSVGNAGLVIKNSDQVPDEFYRNEFHTLYVGSLLQGNNRLPGSQDGLRFRCNTFGREDGTDDCVYDAAITLNSAAIAQNQGGPSDPIGNRFYPECPGGVGDESDVYHDDESLEGIIYYHHTDQFTKPDCSTQPPKVIQQSTTFIFTPGDGSGSSCPADQSGDHLLSEVKATFQNGATDHAQLKALFDGELDGGDTEYLLEQIRDPLVSSFTLRNVMVASMPLKDLVLLAAIDRDPAMDPWHLTEVLLAAGRLNPDVLVALMHSGIDQYFIDLVREAQNGTPVSWKQWLEAELSGLLHNTERARHDYVRKVLEDSTSNPLDSIDVIFNSEQLPSSPAERLSLLIVESQWQEVDEWISVPEEHGLTPHEAIVFGVVRDVAQDPMNAIGTVQDALEELNPIAEDENNSAHILARALLIRHLHMTFEEPIGLPGEERNMIEAFTNTDRPTKGLMRAKPNPVNERLQVMTELPTREVAGYVVLYNVFGIELERTRISTGPQFFEIEVTKYAPGIYRLAMIGRNGTLLDGLSISIVR
ncbi:MAG TPA: sialidase family protein [Flavobacteriales bacterium]|nr:glycoside hydrolase [Flavobacteriales bacterium]HMU14998.1 sialidase family protein [Flavobacteriales bacterium]HNA31485.1 sialidase family protein [Flavobacteriales bacterium]HNM70525.1 sialidase family protein [Flavobacteriales bacterium]HNO04537.1 sialidase family protein [Flavobacteriales bacterium]